MKFQPLKIAESYRRRLFSCCLVFAVIFVLLAKGPSAEEYPSVGEKDRQLLKLEAIRELARSHYAQGREYYRSGEYLKAKQQFEEVLRYLPEHQGAQWYLQFVEKELAKNKQDFFAGLKRSQKPPPKQLEEKQVCSNDKDTYSAVVLPSLHLPSRKKTPHPVEKTLLEEKEASSKAAEESRVLRESQSQERALKLAQYKLAEQDRLRAEQERLANLEAEKIRRQEELDQQRQQERLKAEKERLLKSEVTIRLSEGKYFYKQRQYEQAKAEFAQVLNLDCRNKQAYDYLHKIEQEIEKEQALREKEKVSLQKKKLAAEQESLIKARQKQDKEERKKAQEEKPLSQQAEKENRLKLKRELEQKRREEARLLQEKKAEEKALQQAQKELVKQAEHKAKEEELARQEAEREEAKQELAKKIKLHYVQGKEHYRNKDYIAARKEFKDILILEPNNKYALNAIEKVEATLAKEEQQLKLKKQARQEAERKRRTQAISKYLGQGKVYFYQQRYQEAIEEFGQVLLLEPQNSQGEKYLASCKKELDKAKHQEEVSVQRQQQAQEEALKQAQAKLTKQAGLKDQERKLAKVEQARKEELFLSRQAQTQQDAQAQIREEQKRKSRQERRRLKEEQTKKVEEEKLLRRQAEREKYFLLKRQAEERRKQQLKQRQQERHKAEEERLLKDKIDIHLSEGKYFYKQRQYEQAKGKFTQVLNLDCKNRQADDYLHKIEREMEKEEQKNEVLGDESVQSEEEFDYLGEAEKYIAQARQKILQDKERQVVSEPEIKAKLKRPVSLDFRNANLSYVLNFLTDSYGIRIILASGISLEGKKVTVQVKDMPLENVLKNILHSQGLTYSVENEEVWVVLPSNMDEE